MISRRHLPCVHDLPRCATLATKMSEYALRWSVFDLLLILMQVRVVSVRLRKVFSRRRRFAHAGWLVPEVELQFPTLLRSGPWHAQLIHHVLTILICGERDRRCGGRSLRHCGRAYYKHAKEANERG
jgi:hypothetical protein